MGRKTTGHVTASGAYSLPSVKKAVIEKLKFITDFFTICDAVSMQCTPM